MPGIEAQEGIVEFEAHPVMVYYVLDQRNNAGESRPAIVVRETPTGNAGEEPLLNLVVFVDGENDAYSSDRPLIYRTSVHYDEDEAPGTWHYLIGPGELIEEVSDGTED
jgi:hypothetical protein